MGISNDNIFGYPTKRKDIDLVDTPRQTGESTEAPEWSFGKKESYCQISAGTDGLS